MSNSNEYDVNYSELGSEIMSGCLEEHLDYVRLAHLNMLSDGFNGKLDLLLPVKKLFIFKFELKKLTKSFLHKISLISSQIVIK